MDIENQSNIASAMSREDQHKLINDSFERYLANKTNSEAIMKIIRNRHLLDSEIVEELAISKASKLVEDVNRNIVLSTRVVNEDLDEVEAIVSSRKNFNDMISIELGKKEKRLKAFTNFLSESKLAKMLSSHSKARIIAENEIIASLVEIRKNQRVFFAKDKGEQKICKKIYDTAILAYLKELKLEISHSTIYNTDLFFLYPRRNNLIIHFLIQEFIKTTDLNELEILAIFFMISELIVSILSAVQAIREKLFKQLGVRCVNSKWWLHTEGLLFIDIPDIMFKFVTKCPQICTTDSQREQYNQIVKNMGYFVALEMKEAITSDPISSYKQFLESFLEFTFGVLIQNNFLETAEKIAVSLKNYHYTAYLFIEIGKKMDIKSLIRLWGKDFLFYLIDFTCKLIKEETKAEVTIILITH